MIKHYLITGDTHGRVIERISHIPSHYEPAETALIILGDAGINFYLTIFLYIAILVVSIMELKEYLNEEKTKVKNEIPFEDCIIKDEEALQTSKDLASKEGILCGISSGTNVAAAKKLAKKLGKGKTVVAVLPDTAERYFSTPLFDE